MNDSVSLEPFRETLRSRGALLIGTRGKFEKVMPELAGRVKFVKFPIVYRAPLGKEDSMDYWIAVYPGEEERPGKP